MEVRREHEKDMCFRATQLIKQDFETPLRSCGIAVFLGLSVMACERGICRNNQCFRQNTGRCLNVASLNSGVDCSKQQGYGFTPYLRLSCLPAFK